MNRKERRQVEKKLKLTNFYAKQTLSEKMKRISDNVENGRKKQADFANATITDLQSQRDLKLSDVIESSAEYIAKTNSIPYIDALKQAQELHKN